MTESERWSSWVAGSVVLASAIGLMLNRPLAYPLDDAYITLHNARVLLEGRDQNFQVTALVGATSPAHLAVVAAIGSIVPLPLALYIAASAAAVAYSIGLVRLAFTFDLRFLPRATFVGLGLLASNAPYHLFNGLETGMAMAAVTWSFVFALKRKLASLALLCGAMPAIRPELAVLAAVILIWTLRRCRTDPRSTFRLVGLAAMTAAPWAFWQYATTGRLLASTGSAKYAFFAEAGLPWTQKVIMTVLALAGSGLGAIFVLFLIFGRRSEASRPALAFLIPVVGFLGWSFPGGLTHNDHRYLYPLLPIMLLGIAELGRDKRHSRLGIPCLIAVYFAMGVFQLSAFSRGHAFARELAEVATWAKEHISPEARVLVHDVGYLAFATNLRLHDAVGLKTPSSVAAHERWTLPSAGAGRARAINAIARQGDVSHAIILDAPFWRDLAADLRQTGWVLAPIRHSVPGGYTVYSLIPPIAQPYEDGPSAARKMEHPDADELHPSERPPTAVAPMHEKTSME